MGGVDEIVLLKETLARAAYVAEHLFLMIDQETWRATGGDDMQGHYEGDYHAEQTLAEIRSWAQLADVEATVSGSCPKCGGQVHLGPCEHKP